MARGIYLLLQIPEQSWLLQIRMRLDLVHGGQDLRSLEQLLRLCDGEVAHANTADLASVNKLLEGSPCGRHGHVCDSEALCNWINGGECFVGVLECDGPVHLSYSLTVVSHGKSEPNQV